MSSWQYREYHSGHKTILRQSYLQIGIGKMLYWIGALGTISISYLVSIRIPMLKIRRSLDRLIFNMEIPILGKDGLYIAWDGALLLLPKSSFILSLCGTRCHHACAGSAPPVVRRFVAAASVCGLWPPSVLATSDSRGRGQLIGQSPER